MIKVPYLGSSIPIVLPSLVLAFALLFALLSAFKLKNKALSAFKNVSKTTTEKNLVAKDKEDASKNKKNVSEAIVENILKGERAVLQEIDLAKKKEERNKLLRFNAGAGGPSAPNAASVPNQKAANFKKEVIVEIVEEEKGDLRRSLLNKNKSMMSSINNNEDDDEDEEKLPKKIVDKPKPIAIKENFSSPG